MSPRVTLIAPATSQPRYHRRAMALVDAGCDVDVYAFSRGYYSNNTFPPVVSVTSLGTVRDGSRFGRVPGLLGAWQTLRRQQRREATASGVAYAFGIDCAAIALGSRRFRAVICEIGDLRNAEPTRNVKARVLWHIEKSILRRCAGIVVTSPSFLHEHYEPLGAIVDQTCVVAENRLPSALVERFPRGRVREPGTRIRIGVVGLLRYRNTLEPLLRWVSANPNQFELHVFGDGPLTDLCGEWAKTSDNIWYHGPYKNPDDLRGVYESIDICYSVYDASDRNVRLALPNKLFEAPYFGVGLVVTGGTALASRVQEWGVGIAVDPNQANFVGVLASVLTPDQVRRFSRAACAIPGADLTDDSAGIVELVREVALVSGRRAAPDFMTAVSF